MDYNEICWKICEITLLVSHIKWRRMVGRLASNKLERIWK
jgi:hypothetical protein